MKNNKITFPYSFIDLFTNSPISFPMFPLYPYLRFTYFLIPLLLLTSCEKDITVILPRPEPVIVVEGKIEQGQYPYVILSSSQAYFDPVDSAVIANTIILSGIVIVSDGTTTDTLKLTLDNTFFPPTIYRAENMVGEVGKTYNLTVHAGGKTLTASTTIPTPVALDSTWFKTQPPSDTLGFIWAHLSDPAGLGNNYRWFAKRLGKDVRFVAPIGSVFEDRFINGKKFDFAYNRGAEFNSSADDDNNQERGYFKVGDTVVVKFCTIDRPSFEFYRSFETEVSNNGNPFAAPTNIPSNISGGLGFWGGYGAVYDTVIAK